MWDARLGTKVALPIVVASWVVGGVAVAVPVLTTENGTNIGEKSDYLGYSSFWMTGSDYSITTQGTNTFVKERAKVLRTAA